MKPYNLYFIVLLAFAAIATGCSDDAMTERERTEARFEEELGCKIGIMQWWETSVKIQVEVETEAPVTIWLLSSQQNALLYDYKELQTSGTVIMTAPQGQGKTIYLNYVCQNRLTAQALTLSGKPVETVRLNTQNRQSCTSASEQQPEVFRDDPPYSLSGNSVLGNAEQYQLSDEQLRSFFDMMDLINSSVGYIELNGLTDNYELSSNGPFYVNWASGWEQLQTPHMLGYYYHSPGTYEDIVYVDISETHRWDYIDGYCKVQYQIGIEDDVAGFHFSPGIWYDANFDCLDTYNSHYSDNMDRIGDNAFNIETVYHRYRRKITALRGISFIVDVPIGKHIGFYLRSISEPFPEQWERLRSKGVPPYVSNSSLFRGTCFSAAELNVDGKRRSVIWDTGPAIWMGMEDIVTGGDRDCNDVVFCVVEDMEIYKPDIISPDINTTADYNGRFPWTLAFEDVNRTADFDFNDAVIKLVPDYEKEECCVTLMAVGSTDQMYLYYDGPDGEICFGELHELFGRPNDLQPINTRQEMISTPVVSLDCVPWPRNYTMEQDARRFSIRVKRGTCEDCEDTISLPWTPGELPEALLVAGEWKWPIESVSIISAYPFFPNWSQDPSRISYWDWYKNPNPETFVSY